MSEQRTYDLSEAMEIMARGAEEFLPDFEGKRRAGKTLLTQLESLNGFCGYTIKHDGQGLWFGVGEGHDRLGIRIVEGMGADLHVHIPTGQGRLEKIPGLVLNRVNGLLEGEHAHRSGIAVVVEYALTVIRRERQSLVIRSPGSNRPTPSKG